MLILKHLFDRSYDDLEHEVRVNPVYRAFTWIDAGDVSDAKTILKIARAFGPTVIEQLHRQSWMSRSVPRSRKASISHRHNGRSNEYALPHSSLLREASAC